jgi:hypothetical protein
LSNIESLLPRHIDGEWGDKVHFWPYDSTTRTEPDVIIEFEDVVILIEVKYNSGLSGDDQLDREAELLLHNYKDKKKYLFFLAREDSAIAIYKEHKDNITKDVSFGYITWQQLLDSIQDNESLICRDLRKLLLEKGFGGFRGFTKMNEKTIKAFRTVSETHNTVQEFISRCIALADENGEFELAPMTGNNTFLRWNSDRDATGWAFSDFIVVFQRCSDKKLSNNYRDGALYVLDLNFEWYDVPTANIARYDYDNIGENWASTPISPSEHRIFYDPLYRDIPNFSDTEIGELYCGEAEEPLDRYWGLKRIIGYEIPLSEITTSNVYEKVFGTFKVLSLT